MLYKKIKSRKNYIISLFLINCLLAQPIYAVTIHDQLITSGYQPKFSYLINCTSKKVSVLPSGATVEELQKVKEGKPVSPGDARWNLAMQTIFHGHTIPSDLDNKDATVEKLTEYETFYIGPIQLWFSESETRVWLEGISTGTGIAGCFAMAIGGIAFASGMIKYVMGRASLLNNPGATMNGYTHVIVPEIINFGGLGNVMDNNVRPTAVPGVGIIKVGAIVFAIGFIVSLTSAIIYHNAEDIANRLDGLTTPVSEYWKDRAHILIEGEAPIGLDLYTEHHDGGWAGWNPFQTIHFNLRLNLPKGEDWKEQDSYNIYTAESEKYIIEIHREKLNEDIFGKGLEIRGKYHGHIIVIEKALIKQIDEYLKKVSTPTKSEWYKFLDGL